MIPPTPQYKGTGVPSAQEGFTGNSKTKLSFFVLYEDHLFKTI